MFSIIIIISNLKLSLSLNYDYFWYVLRHNRSLSSSKTEDQVLIESLEYANHFEGSGRRLIPISVLLGRGRCEGIESGDTLLREIQFSGSRDGTKRTRKRAERTRNWRTNGRWVYDKTILFWEITQNPFSY